MTNSKTTKRALLTSILALITCLVMLLGTTFAWFTDSVTSGNNIIKSGTLDVTMEWMDGKLEPAENSDGWADASASAIFDYSLWEPGFTQVRHVKIANEGTLALKYQLKIAATGDVTDLSDVIDVYYADPAVQLNSRTDVEKMQKLGTLTDVLAGFDTTASGTLTEGTSDIVTIALKMQESAGNDYQDKSIGTAFAVELYATQYTYEEDSFDDQYDAGLEPIEDGDVFVEEDGIQYIYTADGEKVLYLVTDAYTSDTVIIPDGVTALGNYSFTYNSSVKNVTVPSSVKSLGRAFDTSAVENVTIEEGITVINNRAFKNAASLKSVNIPSTVTTIEESAFQSSGLTEITVPASVTSIGKAAFGYMPNLKTITVEGSPVIANYAARGCASLETVNLKGANTTFSGTSMAFSNAESGVSDNITIYVENADVEAAVRAANGSCTGYTVVVDTGIVKVSARHYQVTGKKGLMNLGATLTSLNPSEANIITVDLMSDVDLAGETWEPINSMWVIFNGNGHTVSNINCDRDGYVGRSGFWAYGGAVTMNDLTLENVTSRGTQAGTFAGSAEGLKLNNCLLKGTNSVTWEQNPEGSSYFETWNGVGAITGVAQDSTINVEITAGTTVTVTKTGMTTDAPYVDKYTGYIKPNQGTVTDNGTVNVVE